MRDMSQSGASVGRKKRVCANRNNGMRGEVEVIFDLVEVLSVGWVETTITWNETEDNFIWAWLDGGHEAKVQGKQVLFTVDSLKVVD